MSNANISPEDIEYSYVLVEFAVNENESPRGESHVNYLTSNRWQIASQAITGPRSMVVTLWRERSGY